MAPRRIGRHLSGGPDPGDAAATEAREAAREAFSRWPTGVSIVAVREGGRVYALTVGALIPLSLDPPTLVVSLGPNAAAAPFLAEGVDFGVSLLGADQRGLASRYADTFPVGPSPFTTDGPPLIEAARATLACRVQEVLTRADHRLVIAEVVEARTGREGLALVYHGREYREVE